MRAPYPPRHVPRPPNGDAPRTAGGRTPRGALLAATSRRTVSKAAVNASDIHDAQPPCRPPLRRPPLSRDCADCSAEASARLPVRSFIPQPTAADAGPGRVTARRPSVTASPRCHGDAPARGSVGIHPHRTPCGTPRRCPVSASFCFSDAAAARRGVPAPAR